MTYAAGVFIFFHALVHAMYVGQAMQWFELRDDMTWPLGSRFLSSVPENGLRLFAASAIGIASLALMAGAIGILLDTAWGDGVTVVAAAVLSLLHIMLWDGDLKTSPDQGLYGVIINVVIVAWVLAR